MTAALSSPGTADRLVPDLHHHPGGTRRAAGSLRCPRAATDVPAAAATRVAGRTTVTSPGVPSWASEADIGVRRTATGHLPPAGRAATVLARAVVEVISGRRQVDQLRAHCEPRVYAGLGSLPVSRPGPLPHLLTSRVFEPADGVAEASAVFRGGGNVRALAFRLEGLDGRWRITALELG